jgi:uncharacterized membrane protein YidH (DUF202 family)
MTSSSFLRLSKNGKFFFSLQLHNTAHTVNNVGTFIALVFIYLLIIVAFKRLTNEHRMENARVLQNQVILCIIDF